MKATNEINVTTLRWMQIVLHFMETGQSFTSDEFVERCQEHDTAMRFSLVDLIKMGVIRKQDSQHTILVPEMRKLLAAIMKDGSIGYYTYADAHIA